MSKLASHTKLKVIRNLGKNYYYEFPGYALDACQISMAEPSSGGDVLVFANPGLKVGDEILSDHLVFLEGTSYLFDHFAAATANNVVTEKNRGYTPDTFKDHNEIWRITRSMC